MVNAGCRIRAARRRGGREAAKHGRKSCTGTSFLTCSFIIKWKKQLNNNSV